MLFTLDATQRQALLQEVFIGIFQDEGHPNPQEAFAIIKLYISYFVLGNDNEPPSITLPFDYAQWFLERRKELVMQQLLRDIDKSYLAFEQLLAFKVAEGEGFEEEPFTTFLEGLSELTLFKMFVSVIGDPS